MAVNLDIINKSGAWFSYNGQKIGQGRENSKTFLKNNPDIMQEVETKIRANFNEAFIKSIDAHIEKDEDDSDNSAEMEEMEN